MEFGGPVDLCIPRSQGWNELEANMNWHSDTSETTMSLVVRALLLYVDKAVKAKVVARSRGSGTLLQLETTAG